jgi:hypothetical protein
MTAYAEKIAGELALRLPQVRAALELLEAGNTIPFVARYRKEATGGLDEVELRDIRDRNEYLAELDERRAGILASVEEQGKLTPELRARIEAATTKRSWRTSTAPSSRSAAPAPPSRRSGASARWPTCSSPGARRTPSSRAPRPGT